MNKLKILSFAIFLAIICGCSPKTSDLIVGKWEMDNGSKYQIEFSSDGTWSSEFIPSDLRTEDGIPITIEGDNTIRWTGHWKLLDKAKVSLLNNDYPDLNETNNIAFITKELMELSSTTTNRSLKYFRIN